jgi:hypothetical protein
MTDPYSDRTSLCRAYVAGTTVFIGIFIIFIALRVRQPNFPAKLMNSVLLHIYDSGRPIRSNEHLLRHKPYSSTHGHRRVNGCRFKLRYVLLNLQHARHPVTDILISFDLRPILRVGSLGVAPLCTNSQQGSAYRSA